ncbi:MAG: hypothetical protein WC947_10345 [Elusimicrobiota bacterium]
MKNILKSRVGRVLFIILFCVSFFRHHCTAAGDTNADVYKKMSIEELAVKAYELEQVSSPEAREYVDVFFQLAEKYLKANRKDAAMETLNKGLRLKSWDYRHQIMLAELELEKKQYQSARDRINFVKNSCDDETLRSKAEQLFFKTELKNIESKTKPRPELLDHKLYIVRFDGVDPAIVKAIASKIGQEFNIKVQVIDRVLKPDKTEIKHNRAKILGEMTRGIKDKMVPAEYKKMLKEAGLAGLEANTDVEKEKLLKWVILKYKDGRNYWSEVEKSMEDQYNSNVLIEQLERQCSKELRGNKVLGVLGVMVYDIYADGINFVFGRAGEGSGVMSYSRFFDDFTPNHVTMKRAVVQSLSSTGMILGLERCTTPTCARAYPHSLEEHDRKEDKLCNSCIEVLRVNYETRKN